jgi:hypothetical protein
LPNNTWKNSRECDTYATYERIFGRYVETFKVKDTSFVFASQVIVVKEEGPEVQPDHVLRMTTDLGETCSMWVEAKRPELLDNATEEQMAASGILHISAAVRKQITNQANGIFHTYATINTGICFLIVGTYFSVFEFTRAMFDRTQQTISEDSLSTNQVPTNELPIQKKLKEAAEKISLSEIVLEDWVYVHPNTLCFAEPMFDNQRRMSPELFRALKLYVAPPEATFEPSLFDLMEMAEGFNSHHIVSGISDETGGYSSSISENGKRCIERVDR